jgi:predicted DNA-binding transcriptional regulator AlpA
MNIGEPSAEDISLRDAMELAGVSDRTVRRAVRTGELPRRYRVSAHGPQLVFLRADVERWIVAHRWRQRVVVPPPAPTVLHTAVSAAVQQLTIVMTRSQAAMAAMADVSKRLEQHEQQLAMVRTTIDRLTAQLTSAGLRAGDNSSEKIAAEAKGVTDAEAVSGEAQLAIIMAARYG